MSPIRVDKDAKRREIVAAALAVFRRKSLNSITVSDIAAEAGIAKGAVYLYFNSKDDVYMSLLDFTFSELFEEYAQHPEIDDPVEQLEHVFIEGLGEYEEHELEFRFFIAYLGISLGTPQGDVIMKKLRDSFRRNRVTIETIYRRGVAAGRFKKVNPKRVSASLMALLEFIPIQWVIDPKAFALRQTGKTAFEIFKQGIMA